MFNSSYNTFSPLRGAAYKQGLFSSLKGKFNWSVFLNNTQKTLNIINQAIPVFYQIKPVWNNTKTIFKIMGALKEDDKLNTKMISKRNNTPYSTNYKNNQNESINSYENSNNPNFFL